MRGLYWAVRGLYWIVRGILWVGRELYEHPLIGIPFGILLIGVLIVGVVRILS